MMLSFSYLTLAVGCIKKFIAKLSWLADTSMRERANNQGGQLSGVAGLLQLMIIYIYYLKRSEELV